MSPTDADSAVFAALANPARRELLRLLLTGPRSVQELATRFDMTRPSVSEHLRALREAGVVSERRDGRYRYYQLEPEPLMQVRDWLTPYERFWRQRLRDLRGLLDAGLPDAGLPEPTDDPTDEEKP